MENKSSNTDWEQTSINERIKYIVDTFFFNMKKVDEANRRVIDYLFEKEKPGS